ncbi:MAG: flavin monoamine oxidase family protein [Acidimicrobiales bacterium]
MSVDVVVVGAGLAGLTAARDLLAAGRSVVVLEARDRVGGRVLNATTADGTTVEVGGQWIGPTQDRLAKMAADLGVLEFPTWNEGDNLVVAGRRRARYRGAIPKLAPHVLAEIGLAQLRLDRMARTVPLDAPWRARRARHWDSMTVETWIRRHLRTATARDMLRLGVASVFAVEASDLSLLHFLFYSHSGGLLDRLFNVADGAQERRFVGGSGMVPLRLAASLGEAVRLCSPVRGISQDDGGVTVELAPGRGEGAGATVRARRAVVAVPPALASRIHYSPALPATRDQLTQRMPMGSVIKAMAVYEEPFWRTEGLSGQATSDVGPVQLTFDNSPPEGRPGVLLGFLEGRHARELGAWALADRRRAVIEGFARFFGSRAASPLEYIEIDWSAEEWTRGCYGAHLPPGALTQFGPALRTPCGRIHWAGTETSEVWCGYMDGAVRSGERAAAEVSVLL